MKHTALVGNVTSSGHFNLKTNGFVSFFYLPILLLGV